jgi:predicted O-linked N-acetylglucosamine transferase (SPINDLY family)
LRSIDFKLTDEYAESEDAQQFIIERLWPVAGGVFPWHRYPEPAPLTRVGLKISDQAFVCGAFVSLMKLSPRCLALWRKILDRIPSALFAFSPPGETWHASYVRWLEANRIPRDRLIFIPYHKEESAGLARHRILDVALDPLPCGNVNGTMEALACGVPVVTLAGRRHGERLGNALLNRFGITDTIARHDDEYIEIVCRLASDPDWGEALRTRIRAAAVDSSVWDVGAYTRGLEEAFEHMAATREHSTVKS